MNKQETTEQVRTLTEAVGRFVSIEGRTWATLIEAAASLAAADEASKLPNMERAKLASTVTVKLHPVAGQEVVRSISAATYSKRVKVGRMSVQEAPPEVVAKLTKDWHDVAGLTYRDVFELLCDTPSLDKFYEWLPKDATMSKPKGTGRKAGKATPEAKPEPEVSAPESVKATRWDAAHNTTAARAVVNSLRAQGADDVSIRLVLAEAARLMTPVRSVPAAEVA